MSRHKHPAYGSLLLAVTIEPKEVGRRIASARERKGWTQLQLALEASVSPSSVQRWESGRLPPVRELLRIADLLGVPAESFVEPEPAQGDLLVGLQAVVSRLEMVAERLEVQAGRRSARDARKPA